MRYGKKYAKYQRNINAVDFIYSAEAKIEEKKFVSPAQKREKFC